MSRSKGNQTMKSGQLIEYNKRNLFVENHARNEVEILFLDPFSKNEKSGISLDQ